MLCTMYLILTDVNRDLEKEGEEVESREGCVGEGAGGGGFLGEQLVVENTVQQRHAPHQGENSLVAGSQKFSSLI